MRVELFNANSYNSAITSSDPELIGRWFAEHAPAHMSADSRIMSQIRIWPETDQDIELLRSAPLALRFTHEGLLALAQVILDAAAKLGELENAESR